MGTVLSWLADHESMFPAVCRVLSVDDFSLPPYHMIASVLFDQISRGAVNIGGIIGSFPDEEDQEFAAEIFSRGMETEDPEIQKKLLNDCVVNIRVHSIEQKMAETSDISKVLELRKEREKIAGIRVFEE